MPPPSKPPVKRNTSILNFFKKSDTPVYAKPSQHRITNYLVKGGRNTKNGLGSPASSRAADTSGELFFEDEAKDVTNATTNVEGLITPSSRRSGSPHSDWEETARHVPFGDKDESPRYNESGGSVKRRRTCPGLGLEGEGSDFQELFHQDSGSTNDSRPSDGIRIEKKKKKSKVSRSGPFFDESDSEEESPFSTKRIEEPSPQAKSVENTLGVGSDCSGNLESKTSSPYMIGGEPGPDDFPQNDYDDDNPHPPDDPLFEEDHIDVRDDLDGLPDDVAAVCPICQVRLDGLDDTVSHPV